ncbi:kelch-like protein 24 [Arctopsyche grandis]|uniref:kelch-like protein 24 n=1 Tax=Arctopsyche grandis TaxID=121162 RepID=UPI00406D7875
MIKVKTKQGFATNRLNYFHDAMRENKFTDVYFAVRNRSFFAHMIVLSACSEFFIENRYKLSATFSEFEYPVINAMLKYCYLGEIHINDEHFKEFLQLADKLQIKSIAPRYETIDQKNCLEVLRLSDDPILKEKAMILTLDNFKTLYKTPSFLNLPASALAEILKSDELNLLVEVVFNSVKLWVNSDEENRRSVLVELLSSIKLTSNEFLVKEVMVFCSVYPECIAILQKAMQSLLNPIQTEDITNYEKIALVGDNNLSGANTIDIYDGKNNSWTLSKDFDLNRSYPASVLVDDWMLIIGGYNSSDKVDYIDLKTGQKHQLNPLNEGRHCLVAVTLRRNSSTDVYVIGGTHNGKALSSVER